MIESPETLNSPTKISLSPKVVELGTTLQQSLVKFEEVVQDLQQLYDEANILRAEIKFLKEKCTSQLCGSSEALKKVITVKDNIIQNVASILTRLNDTKDFSYINHAFKALCGEILSITPLPIKQNNVKPPNEQPKIKQEKQTIDQIPLLQNVFCKSEKVAPENDLNTSITDEVIFNGTLKEESISEIDATPGRKSPIIQPRKGKNCLIVNIDGRDKKKYPNDWGTPEKKTKYSKTDKSPKTPGSGKLRQARLTFYNCKPLNVVDLTSSPEFNGGVLSSQNTPVVQKLIKKESSDNDDTILPSPTSTSVNFQLHKTCSKENQRFKKPLSLSRTKTEDVCKEDRENKAECTDVEMEESVNLLRPNRRTPKKKSPIKCENQETMCDASMSLLDRVNVLDKYNQGQESVIKKELCSPSKTPLAENKNFTNIPLVCDTDSSMSLLQPEPRAITSVANDDVKRKTPPPFEPIYKEPTVRKKAEKHALPAWCCDECEKFYGVLYKDDPEKIAKVIKNCGRHRGKNNPARPKTPPGYWNPRWDVPEDTEEFNRRNNAV